MNEISMITNVAYTLDMIGRSISCSMRSRMGAWLMLFYWWVLKRSVKAPWLPKWRQL